MNRPDWLKGIFFFTKSEIRGLVVLLSILVLVLIIRYSLVKKIKRYELQSILLTDTVLSLDSGLSLHAPNPDSETFPVSFDRKIDPNKASANELLAIGIPARVVHNLIAYRGKGATFNLPEDIMRVYGFDTLLYLNVKDYLFIDKGQEDYSLTSKKSASFFRIEINSADSTNLRKLPGIGSVLSARIIKYRNLLGGFYSIKQLNEVYGINDSLIVSLSKYLEVDTLLIKKLDVNSLTLEELDRHPYITKNQARAILSYRRIMGPFTNVNQLVTNYLISENEYFRVLPYLEIN